MPSLTAAAVVAAVALVAPLLLRLVRSAFPEVALLILLGVLIGPQGLGWALVDEPVSVLATVGLAFLLLLSGLEIDFDRLRGVVLRLTAVAFAISVTLAILVGWGLSAAGLVVSPVLIAVILSATSLGIILPALKDANQIDTSFGQVIVAGASVAEVVPIIALSVLFSERAAGVVPQLALLATFAIFVTVVGVVIFGLERWKRLSRTLITLQGTTAEIRVRGAFALLMVFAALASGFGLEAILGAFLAGATLKLLDRDDGRTHQQFHSKLQAVGFGVFIPFFFLATGMTLDAGALVHDLSTLGRVPIFLAALLVVRALPAVFYAPLARSRRQIAAAGLLQATSLSIPVVAGRIGVELRLIPPGNYTALVAAGLLSVVLFPALALPLLKRTSHPGTGAFPTAPEKEES